MKILEQYQCGTCGTVYGDKERCDLCEKIHQKVVKIEKLEYSSIDSDIDGKYPVGITLLFENGTTKDYVLCCILKKEYDY